MQRPKRLTLDGHCVTGLVFCKKGKLHPVKASQIILTADAINSPKLLELSNVG